MPTPSGSRVITVAPLPPEKCAYALARYSRSPDSISDSLDWVRAHDSSKFLESFYFQYGHASIADLGHVVMCFEGVSELAATEIEDEPLWDGQARSSRYQDFGRTAPVIPPEFNADQARRYQAQCAALLAAYRSIHDGMVRYLSEKLPRPEGMKPDAYQRNIAARAFDVARYCLPFGIPTGVGQVTSIRTLERQIRRLKTSEYAELRGLADEIAAACTRPPLCGIAPDATAEAVAPTLAKFVEADQHWRQARRDLRGWAAQNLPPAAGATAPGVDLVKVDDVLTDIAASLLYPETDRPYRELYDTLRGWSAARRREVLDTALQSRTPRDELLRGFRSAPYAFDIVMDIGAYRDLHRHRRCHQLRQDYTHRLGYAAPSVLAEAGLVGAYREVMEATQSVIEALPAPGAHYLLPFAARSRFLFKMDFAEAEYIARLRSGVKGHFSYREVAWQMRERLQECEPLLAELVQATPPWVEDPLRR